MANAKKKTILMYFLQKTSGTYSESSLAYLHDLLRREGIITGSESVETTASELASFVRDGSYLKVSTKKVPEHIRAQIDFHLQKSRRTSKKQSSTNATSAFDELLASIDSDDPKFTMDTTLGLDFSSLEELESDLKKHALDSLSPSLFSRDARQNARTYAREYVAPVNNDDFADVDDVYEREQNVRQSARSSVAHNVPLENVSETLEPETNLRVQQPAQSLQFADTFGNNIVPQFPTGTMMQPTSQMFSMPQNFSQSIFSQDALQSANQKNEQQQFFAQLQLRASLLDAKERLLSSRISSSNDPAVLRAVAMLDEKLLQFTQQQNAMAQSTPQQFAPQQFIPQQNLSSAINQNVLQQQSGLNGVSKSESKSLSSQIKLYVQEIMGAQKSLHELQQVFVHTRPQEQVIQASAIQQITPAQVREMAKQEKQEVTKLRAQLTNLQEQFSKLSSQIVDSQQNIQNNQYSIGNSQQIRGRVKPLRATAIHRHDLKSHGQELVPVQKQLAEPAQITANDFNSISESDTNDFESEVSTLQKMYALLAVGMRELSISPTRARHIYEQLQRLYTTLSFDQKPIIYPSIVEFYASLTNQMRGVQ